jgi:hypothetical protein
VAIIANILIRRQAPAFRFYLLDPLFKTLKKDNRYPSPSGLSRHISRIHSVMDYKSVLITGFIKKAAFQIPAIKINVCENFLIVCNQASSNFWKGIKSPNMNRKIKVRSFSVHKVCLQGNQLL